MASIWGMGVSRRWVRARRIKEGGRKRGLGLEG